MSILEKTQDLANGSAHVTGYIDDIGLAVSGDSLENNCYEIEQLHALATESWAATHGAKFETSKYELIYFTRDPKQAGVKANITLGQTQITPRRVVQYLGLRLDSQLWWRQHIEAVFIRGKKSIGALRQLLKSIWNISLVNMRKAYQAIIIPQLLYTSLVWYGSGKRRK